MPDYLSTYTDIRHLCQNVRVTRLINLILTACILFSALYRPATAQSVHIPDPSLRAVIESALGKEAGATITQSEMESLESLHANRCLFLTLSKKGWFTPIAERWICETTDDTFISSINSLKGLEFATNIIELELGRNQISDVTPLKDLINLTRLSLGINRISDISALKNLTNLTHLSLINNEISDATPLKYLTNLIELDLLNNKISDMTPLKNLTTLKYLSLRDNQILDVAPLKDMTKLIYLSLRDNRISDVTQLKNMTNLEYINIFNNRIPDVTPLKDMIKLKHLDIDGNQISDVSALKNMKNLIHLDISDNKISDLTPLKDLTTLLDLDLDSNGISDISSLKDLTNLAYLDLAHNEISDLSALKALTKLRRIELEDNQILDVIPLKNLTNLTELDLSDNHISDFSPINELIDNLIEYNFSNQTEPPVGVGTETLFSLADVNRDGVVNLIDMVLVAQNFDNSELEVLAQANMYPDVNNDGIVDLIDLLLVAVEMGSGATAPVLTKNLVDTSNITVEKLAHWIRLAKQLDVGVPNLQKGIVILEQLLVLIDSEGTLPKTTALLPNYPNPFNPETWIPYQLTKPADVNVLIHSIDGKLIRTLELGQLPAGVYKHKSRAAYWDGQNAFGESVASGVYFYTLTASDFTATGKMFIRK